MVAFNSSIIHEDPSPLAGQTVTIQSGNLKDQQFRVEDWLDRVLGRSWQDAEGNPGCVVYAFRAGASGLPPDDEVLYGKIGNEGVIIHLTELSGSDDE